MSKNALLRIRVLTAIAIGIICSSGLWGQIPSPEMGNDAEIRALMLSFRYGSEPVTYPLSQFRSDQRPAFFCRQEKALEESLRFPIRFRLGEWNYTQQMEGKGIQYFQSKSE
jgi:hypothetical protein